MSGPTAQPSPARRVVVALLSLALLGALSSCKPRPTLVIPTPDCGSPTLAIGETTFRVETLKPAADGSLAVPAAASGVAWWIEGTAGHDVFVVGPAAENLALEKSLLPSLAGKTAKVTWQDCNSTSYELGSPEDGSFSASALPARSSSGITIFFERDASGSASVVGGDLVGEVITTRSTPAGGAQVQAEITLPEVSASPDGRTITLKVSITNTGTTALTLSAADVSLLVQDAAALSPTGAEPSLPRNIRPGRTETIAFTFPRPSSPSATLKIFDVEYDVEGY